MKIFQVDAFTNKPFTGNPAGVCILPRRRSAGWMQNVAREMNLSETAFVVKKKDHFNLRWFTPAVEVDLCGHATLAGAHIIWETGLAGPREAIRFSTKSGYLSCSREGSWIQMDFPAEPAADAPCPELARALRVEPVYCGRNRMDYIVEVSSQKIVRDLSPDMMLLGKVETRGVIVTAPSGSKQYDFVSRFFAPRVGVPEDPVTGSSQTCLGPYWGKRLKKDSFLSYQASQRGGWVKVRNAGDRVIIGGQAVTVMECELL